MHAEIARELAQARDPFALTLSGVRYVDKPPLLYSLMALVFTLGGPSELTARLVPALAGVAAVVATAWLGARLLDATGGLLAGMALLTCVGFFAYGRYVRPESLFVASLAWGFALTLVGLAEGRRRLVAWGIVGFGMAALAKDLVGVVAPLGAIGLALALSGRARPLVRWLPWAGVVPAFALGFAWWIVAEWRTPGFVWYTVVDNHLRNVARTRVFPDEDVSLTALQFLAVGALAAAPWIVAAGAAVAALVRRRAWREPKELAWVVLALWSTGVFTAMALSPFRLPHYALRAYPALALLAARAWRQSRSRALVWAHAVVFAALGLACALAWSSDGSYFMTGFMEATDVASRKTAVVGQANPLPQWEGLRALLGGAALAFAFGALATAAVAGRRRFVPGLGALSVAVTMLALMPSVAGGLSLVASHRAVRGLGLEIARRAGAHDIVAHEGPLEDSGALEWYSRRRPVIIDGRRSVLAFGATLPGAAGAFWDAETARAKWEGPARVWAVTTRDPTRSMLARLPGSRLVAATGGRWLYVNMGGLEGPPNPPDAR
jgi:4-amino-4-deoxy-L-arabinose transferase-like glycosyltransferase